MFGTVSKLSLSALAGLFASDLTSSSDYLDNPVNEAMVSYEPVKTEYVGISNRENDVMASGGLEDGTLERKVGVNDLDSGVEMQDSVKVYSDSEARAIYNSWSSEEQDEFDRSREAYGLKDPTPFQEDIQEASAQSIFGREVDYSNLGDGDLMTLYEFEKFQELELEKSQAEIEKSQYEFEKFDN